MKHPEGKYKCFASWELRSDSGTLVRMLYELENLHIMYNFTDNWENMYENYAGVRWKSGSSGIFFKLYLHFRVA